MGVDARGDSGVNDGLLERQVELAALSELLKRATAGAGGAIVVEGAAGLGKSTMLEQARALAGDLGLRVASARGAELEQTFPYGVVRQFFESFLFTVEPAGRRQWLEQSSAVARAMAGGADAPADEFALLHGLYWMCVKVADSGPLLMVLDDAQWADESSLHFVEFLTRRLERVSIAVVIGTRPAAESSPRSHVALLTDPAVHRLRLSPLSSGAVQDWVRSEVRQDVDARFSSACHEVTRGNPFLLTELLREVAAEGLDGNAATAERVRSLGPRGVAQVVLLRLGRLSPQAQELAAALAVAAPDSPVNQVGALAGLDGPAAMAAALELESAEVAVSDRGLRFTHPIMRAAVYEDLPGTRRSALHARAAQLAESRGATPAEVAGHLLHVAPGADSRLVQSLRAAAATAISLGDFGVAERLLGRALEETIEDQHVRVELQVELGRAEARTGNPAGVARLQQAVESAAGPSEAAEIAVELTNILKFSLEPERAATVAIRAAERLDEQDPALTRRLKAELLGTRFLTAATTEVVGEHLSDVAPAAGEPRDLLDAFLLAAAAFDEVAGLGSAAAAREYGRRALSGGVVPVNPALGGQALVVASVALIWAEDFDYVFGQYSEALERGREQGSPLVVGNASAMRAMCAYRMGRLLDADADATTALELAEEVPAIQALLAPATAYAVLAGLDRGRPLGELAGTAFDERLELGRQTLPFTQLSWARGELCLARENWEQALIHFRDCNRAEPGYGGLNPAMVAWREGAALALLHLGETAEARSLAADAVQRAARFGSDRGHGVALRAQALVEAPGERVDRLRQAVLVLERSGAELELARTRTDLGAALRAAGERNQAQETLGEALTGAARLGAARIGERAREELAAAGVRPRSLRSDGVDGLTPSERRVAELAGHGRTNREIAQALFVTEKTVETHLSHVYDKLGVRSRRKLPEMLGLTAAT